MDGQMIGKLMVLGGLALAAVGGAIWLLGRAGFKGLPGDIHVQKDGFSFSFPIVTCIVLSIILTIVLNLVLRR